MAMIEQGQVKKTIQGETDRIQKDYNNSKFANITANVSTGLREVHDAASNAMIFTLSRLWLGIGIVRPAKTDKDASLFPILNKLKKGLPQTFQETDGNTTDSFDRFDYTKLYSLQLGDYFLPVSQTFTLKAKKRLNISSLVDGIDIIQQTRKEAKQIECVLRISLRENQDALKLVDAQNSVLELSQFLADLYETDAVFKVNNDMINNTFRVMDVMITDYKFVPRAGSMTYTFEFTLTEVKYGENVLTFNLRQVDADQKQQGSQTGGQITG